MMAPMRLRPLRLWPFGQAPVRIRAAEAGDTPRLAQLHAACFARGWSEDEFAALVREATVTGHVAARDGEICGFILSRAAADEAEILTVAVDRRARGQGLGRRLIEPHLNALRACGVEGVFLEVEDGNLPAQRLYARAGFREVGRRGAYYAGADATRRDALVLARRLA
jgi:ribosomal-protein-alanine N-acetyltransferase